MIPESVNIFCPRDLNVRPFYYYIVHPHGKKYPLINGCEFCDPDTCICKNCASSVLKILTDCWENEEFVPNPIHTGLEHVSGFLQD